MTNLGYWLWMVTILAFLAGFAVSRHKRLDVRVGQVWTYTTNKDNPWSQPIILTNLILETRDGWVRYQCTRNDGFTTERQEPIRWFTVGAKRVQE